MFALDGLWTTYSKVIRFNRNAETQKRNAHDALLVTEGPATGGDETLWLDELDESESESEFFESLSELLEDEDEDEDTASIGLFSDFAFPEGDAVECLYFLDRKIGSCETGFI